MTEAAHTIVRALHGAALIHGVDPLVGSIHYRIFHPALFTNSAAERQTGILSPLTDQAPWPVVVILGGINVNTDGYRWFAERCAASGIAAVLYSHIGTITPGEVGLSPGIDLDALRPDTFGTRPSCTTLAALLEAIARENETGRLAGLLDCTSIGLLGHSAGGTVALLNANPEWFPGVAAVASFAAHTMPAAILGHPEGTVLPVHPGVAALILNAGRDEVIEASIGRYVRADGSNPTDHHPVLATFRHAVTAQGSALVTLRDARHLTLCDPVDTTTARGFLEGPDPHGAEHRDCIARLLLSFFGTQLQGPSAEPTNDPTAACTQADRELISDLELK
jgi:dienelactone hydrolase